MLLATKARSGPKKHEGICAIVKNMLFYLSHDAALNSSRTFEAFDSLQQPGELRFYQNRVVVKFKFQ